MIIHKVGNDEVHITFNEEAAFWGFRPWIAVWEGYDGAPIDYNTPSRCPIGYGYTEQEALDNLLEESNETI